MALGVTQLKAEYRPDNERLDKFIDLYLDYEGDHIRAWKDAGYSSTTTKGAMAKLRQHWDVVQSRIVERIGRHVPRALSVVIDIMENASQASIRLKAAQDILGRAGYDQASKIELTEKKAEDMGQDELRNELAILMKRANKESETAQA